MLFTTRLNLPIKTREFIQYNFEGGERLATGDSPVHVLWDELGIKAIHIKCNGSARGNKLVLSHIYDAGSECLHSTEGGVSNAPGTMWLANGTHQFYFDNSFVTVIEEVFRFSAIDSNDTEK